MPPMDSGIDTRTCACTSCRDARGEVLSRQDAADLAQYRRVIAELDSYRSSLAKPVIKDEADQ